MKGLVAQHRDKTNRELKNTVKVVGEEEDKGDSNRTTRLYTLMQFRGFSFFQVDRHY